MKNSFFAITPVPKPRKQKGKASVQGRLGLGDEAGLSTKDQEYNPTPIINEIRQHVASWRALPNPSDWGVTPTTARLLTHWRHHTFETVRPFFCQVEAVEPLADEQPVQPRVPDRDAGHNNP